MCSAADARACHRLETDSAVPSFLFCDLTNHTTSATITAATRMHTAIMRRIDSTSSRVLEVR
jgi:hypothetical protein